MKISIIKDTEINSDHMLILSNIDLGLKKKEVCKDKEEQIDFKRILSIPVHIKPGSTHPTLNTTVYKGADFCIHAQLFETIQNTINDETNGFLDRISHIHKMLLEFEDHIITRMKESKNKDEQEAGKLIRTTQDAIALNDVSGEVFTLLNDTCQLIGLAHKVPVIQSNSFKAKRKDVIGGEIMPGVVSIATTKQIDEAFKRSRSVSQRVSLLMKAIIGARIRNLTKKAKIKHTAMWSKNSLINMCRFRKQQ